MVRSHVHRSCRASRFPSASSCSQDPGESTPLLQVVVWVFVHTVALVALARYKAYKYGDEHDDEAIHREAPRGHGNPPLLQRVLKLDTWVVFGSFNHGHRSRDTCVSSLFLLALMCTFYVWCRAHYGPYNFENRYVAFEIVV